MNPASVCGQHHKFTAASTAYGKWKVLFIADLQAKICKWGFLIRILICLFRHLFVFKKGAVLDVTHVQVN